MTDLIDEKIKLTFNGKIVKKELTETLKRTAGVPSYVIEYLMGMYCTSDNEEELKRGFEKVKSILSSNFVHPDESEIVKSRIVESKEDGYLLIDKVQCYFDESERIYDTVLYNLKIRSTMEMPHEYILKYPKLLASGVWGMIRIKYLNENENPFVIDAFEPIQMASFDINEVFNMRNMFNRTEWQTLVLRSVGYEPNELDNDSQMYILERIVPLIERNYNLCELGPRGTGKSHIYKEISPYSILISGGKTSVANLFCNMRTGSIGLIGCWDCVAFDEVAGVEMKDPDSIQILKDYMASGSFVRGKSEINAGASIVYNGNIDDGSDYGLKGRKLFEPFPKSFNRDSAFFDRIHCYIPGWRIPKMSTTIITKNFGWITDYFSEYCKEMRKFDYSDKFDEYFKLNDSCNIRDEKAIRKTFSGLAKILYPGQELSKEECEELLKYAIEGRKRVKNQLAEMASEFSATDLDYLDKWV